MNVKWDEERLSYRIIEHYSLKKLFRSYIFTWKKWISMYHVPRFKMVHSLYPYSLVHSIYPALQWYISCIHIHRYIEHTMFYNGTFLLYIFIGTFNIPRSTMVHSIYPLHWYIQCIMFYNGTMYFIPCKNPNKSELICWKVERTASKSK